MLSKFLGIWTVSLVLPLVGTLVRSKWIWLEDVSVGLRLSEIDGHFEVAISVSEMWPDFVLSSFLGFGP